LGYAKSTLRMAGAVALIALVFVVAAGCAPRSGGAAGASAVQPAVSDPAGALEARSGIRITRLALINVSAMVDFQYLVTDAEKANE
jgi:hypothetical protein